MLWLPTMEAQDNPWIETSLLLESPDTEIEHAQEFHHVNQNDFEKSDPNNPTRLTIITRELDDLCQ